MTTTVPTDDAPGRHLLAVDGNSLAHRAWHAINGSDDAVGEFVVGGVVSLVAAVWHHGPYDAVLVAFDHEHNERKEAHPGYKAGRTTDPDLGERLARLPERLADAGVPTACVHGAEADDLLASTAVAATERGWRTDVLSGDRDLTALVGAQVRLLRPRATMSDLVVYDDSVVRAEYGVAATQYRDFAALRGDPSDGLPGVDGIGPKTAATLLADHDDLDGLFANLCYLPPKLERALRRGRDLAFANRTIMAPLPVEVSLGPCTRWDLEATTLALSATDDPGIQRAARRWARAIERARRPAPPPHAAWPTDEWVPAAGVPAGMAGTRPAADPGLLAPSRGAQQSLF